MGTAITFKSHEWSSSGAGVPATGQADVSDHQVALQVMGLRQALEEVDEN